MQVYAGVGVVNWTCLVWVVLFLALLDFVSTAAVVAQVVRPSVRPSVRKLRFLKNRCMDTKID